MFQISEPIEFVGLLWSQLACLASRKQLARDSALCATGETSESLAAGYREQTDRRCRRRPFPRPASHLSLRMFRSEIQSFRQHISLALG
jgi:hypothetical protein